MDGITVTANTYEETKKILLARYGDSNRNIQAHMDFLESLPPATSATTDELNTTFIECHRRIQALRALGENVNGYGRVLVPKIIRAFPTEFCQRWIVHVKRQGLSEGSILIPMVFFREEVDGALIALKIRGESTDTPTKSHQQRPFTLVLNSHVPGEKADRRTNHFVFCEANGHWAQECKKVTSVTDRKEKRKSAHRRLFKPRPQRHSLQ